VVADTFDAAETDALLQELASLPGVQGVDVVMVDFSDTVEGAVEDTIEPVPSRDSV
jgi:hypothetical protein